MQAGVASLFVSDAIAVADAPGRPGRAWDYYFFDERFDAARRLAGELSGATRPTPVHADVTSLWTGELGEACLATPLAMQGVTTGSFYFCLKVLLSDHARVESQIRRIGRDLHLWTISTENHSRNGVTRWQDHFHPV